MLANADNWQDSQSYSSFHLPLPNNYDTKFANYMLPSPWGNGYQCSQAKVLQKFQIDNNNSKTVKSAGEFCLNECNKYSIMSNYNNQDLCCELATVSGENECYLKEFTNGSAISWNGINRTFLILSEANLNFGMKLD